MLLVIIFSLIGGLVSLIGGVYLLRSKKSAVTLAKYATPFAAEKIMAVTNNRGVDVAVEAIGIPSSFEICQEIVTAGGHIANVGVHGKPVQLNLEKLWSQNITLTTGLVDTVTTPLLLKTVLAGKLPLDQLVTHHFMLDQSSPR